MKAVPKLDESESGQMVLEKVKITYYSQTKCGMACVCSLFLGLRAVQTQSKISYNPARLQNFAHASGQLSSC